jgi:uncharacterized protein with LGFP repeats
VNDIHSEYQHLGAESSTLGAPISQEGGLPDGRGRVEIFRRGAIYWNPNQGARFELNQQ